MAIAGRVAIVPKGDWSADATYKRLDAVTYNNTLYFAKKEVPAGTATSNTEYWSKSIVGSVVTVDDALSPTSTNPVQNKVVKAYVDKKASENVDFSTSTSKTLNDTVEAPLMIGNATRNLLNPTEQSITQDGITCTNNGDGTYTLNGTNTSNSMTYFRITSSDRNMANSLAYGITYKLVGIPKSFESKLFLDLSQWLANYEYGISKYDRGDGVVFTKKSDSPLARISIGVEPGANLSNVIVKPMLTTDLEATIDDFVPYSGYDIKTVGKNLLNPTLQTTTQNGITCTNNGDGTYTFNGTATGVATFIVQMIESISEKHLNENLWLVGCPKNSSTVAYSLQLWIKDHGTISDIGDGVKVHIEKGARGNIGIVFNKGTQVNNLVFKPMLTTNLSATYDDFVPYTESTVHIDSSTEFPLLGLKTFDGVTNIISPGNVKVTYAKSEIGAALLSTSENKLDKDNVVNNQTTTVEGFALDARQANPNIDGTLAKQVADLNGSLNNVFYAVKETKDANDADFGITRMPPNSNYDTSTHNPFPIFHTILLTIPFVEANGGYAVQIGVSITYQCNGKIAVRNKDHGNWQDWNIITGTLLS